MELTTEQISRINNDCPSSEQGVYLQPYGIPTTIKELVIYSKYKTGGYSGGNCLNNASPKYQKQDEPENKFIVLDLVLAELTPNISYLQYRLISKLIHTNEESENEYYGNCTDYKIEYIVLSELIKLLETFKN